MAFVILKKQKSEERASNGDEVLFDRSQLTSRMAVLPTWVI